MPSWLQRAVRGICRYQDRSRVFHWTCDFRPDEKWHKKDRLYVRDHRGRQVFEAHFKIRKDGTGFVIYPEGGSGDGHEAVMSDGWDVRAPASCIILAVFVKAVPPHLQREALGMKSVEDGRGLSAYCEFKPVQHKIRQSREGWDDPSVWPNCVRNSLKKLQVRYNQLNGLDVQEEIQRLERPFRFLHEKGVSFDRIRQAWDEAAVAEVMRS